MSDQEHDDQPEEGGDESQEMAPDTAEEQDAPRHPSPDPIRDY